MNNYFNFRFFFVINFLQKEFHIISISSQFQQVSIIILLINFFVSTRNRTQIHGFRIWRAMRGQWPFHNSVYNSVSQNDRNDHFTIKSITSCHRMNYVWSSLTSWPCNRVVLNLPIYRILYTYTYDKLPSSAPW